MIVPFRVVDLETTGMAPPKEVIEFGLTDVLFDTETKTSTIGATTSVMFRAEHGIPPEASGVHHIIDADVADRPVFDDAILLDLVSAGEPYALVAHKRDFELQWLKPEIIGPRRWIDTYKCAKRLLPDAPDHKNGTLPYLLGVQFDRARAQPSHRAGPDSYVTAVILAEFLKMATGAELVEWTKAPMYYATCPLRRWKDQRWEDMDAGSLQWIAFKADDLDADLKAAAKGELARRQEARTAQQQPQGAKEST